VTKVPILAADPLGNAWRIAVELRLEVDEIQRTQFPSNFPPLLNWCINFYLSGPNDPQPEDPAAWWVGARRQVLLMVERYKQNQGHYAAWPFMPATRKRPAVEQFLTSAAILNDQREVAAFWDSLPP
jgi:hypothetical protein